MTEKTIFMAVSVDGYIAGPENETPWTDAEWDNYKLYLGNADVLIIGRRTYEVMRDANEFTILGNPNVIVVTRDAFDNVECVSSPEGALLICKDRGWEKVIFGGGTQLNSYVMDRGMADTLHLDIEPIVLGGGIPLFSKMPMRSLNLIKLETLSSGTISVDYKIKGESNA